MFWWNVFLGRTVFPGLNISVLPQRGSALLWMTVWDFIDKCVVLVKRKWREISSRFDQRSSMTQECSTWVVLLPGVKHYIIVLLCSWFQFFSISRGNKWAATKWVYSDPQMWTQPCRVDKPHNYPPFQNSFLWPPQQCLPLFAKYNKYAKNC